jgi:hypothetical protein
MLDRGYACIEDSVVCYAFYITKGFVIIDYYFQNLKELFNYEKEFTKRFHPD